MIRSIAIRLFMLSNKKSRLATEAGETIRSPAEGKAQSLDLKRLSW
jgi:hypothetical protein